jgi:peptidoglycan/LPS O-acetylase OafA/YrhL
MADSNLPPTSTGDRRLGWVDALKGVALVWVLLNHLSERVLGSPLIGNPFAGWPPLDVRVRQLAPLHGHGFWDLPLNLFRYVGWTGDQGVGLFLFAAGFGLAWSHLHRRPGGWIDFARRRLLRLFPMWWVLHCAVLAAGLAGKLRLDRGFLLSVIGLRVTSSTFYAYVPAWWFFTLLIQLYVVYPLLWSALNRWPFRLLALSAAACFAARALGLAYLDTYMDPWLRGAVFVTRLPEFVLGMVFARALFLDPKAVEVRLCGAAGRLTALGLYLLGTGLALTWWGNVVSPFLLVAGGFGLLYPILARASSRNALAWLGVHSLSIFLVHHLFIDRVVPGTPASVTAGVVGRMAAAVVGTLLASLAFEWGMEFASRILTMLRQRLGSSAGEPARS